MLLSSPLDQAYRLAGDHLCIPEAVGGAPDNFVCQGAL